ncbi:DUF5999 family protein [Streptomyces resistomycificus]|uniref:Uncharacterized protein n=1 Tax=Streptomyces resistomycificus TaxID=67356 RepID=A0A0L8KX48_9ACTN|nr:DUF5999 family protein [Streptomyces resistomycificus]KOG30528.1 hypothetical protein ADK37_33830 [Streptomyces resistomycificus]KUO02143.1 hypothetical protein AQJ84_00270 [Streptomyces resistomycificus]
MCSHQPSCPATAGNAAPHVVAAHPEQGWNLLCDGAIVFDDTGELLPDGRIVAPHRVPVERLTIAA